MSSKMSLGIAFSGHQQGGFSVHHADYVVASFHRCSFACEPQKSTVFYHTSRIIIFKMSTFTSGARVKWRLFDAGGGKSAVLRRILDEVSRSNLISCIDRRGVSICGKSR